MAKKIKVNKRAVILLFIIMIIIFAYLISRSMSKYMLQLKGVNHAQQSTEFYFESEMASIEGKEYTINNWNGTSTETISFDIKNYANNLLKTSENITYSIETKIIDDNTDDLNDEDLIGVGIYDSSDNAITTTQELLNTDFNQKDYTLKITPKVNNLENGKTFNIELTISSIMPYTKNLKANITVIVNKIDDYTATLTDSINGEYSTLNLKVNNTENDITVQYDNTKIILDKSNYIVNDVDITVESNISSFVIEKANLEKINYEINFIKKVDTIVLGQDIIVN